MSDRFLLFPKNLKHLSVPALTDVLIAAGCDGMAIPVRKGFWVTPDHLEREIGELGAVLSQAGLVAPYAILPWSASELIAHSDPVRICAAHGVRQIRIGYFKDEGGQPDSYERARRDLAQLAPIAEAQGVQIIIQLHHGTLHPSPEAAWMLVHDLDPRHNAVKIDPGNQQHEGRSQPRRTCALLSRHLAAVGVKDAAWTRGPNGQWQLSWVPLAEGCAEWPKWMAALASSPDLTWVLNDFAWEASPHDIESGVAAAVAWLRQHRTAPTEGVQP